MLEYVLEYITTSLADCQPVIDVLMNMAPSGMLQIFTEIILASSSVSKDTLQTGLCSAVPTCADNVALPAFARRTPLLQQSVDTSYVPPGPQQQIGDRHTDMPVRRTSCSAYDADGAICTCGCAMKYRFYSLLSGPECGERAVSVCPSVCLTQGSTRGSSTPCSGGRCSSSAACDTLAA